MRTRQIYTLGLATSALLFIAAACGDSSDAPADGGDMGGGESVQFADVGVHDTGAIADTAPQGDSVVSGDLGGGSDAASVNDAGACMVWEIAYDLENSLFEIADTPFGAGNQVNTLTTPYDADDHVGPGTMVLRFQDVGGAPGGLAAISSYAMTINFVVSGVTTVVTDLEASAGPSACGVTTGDLQGTTVAWAPSALVGHHSTGELLCTGSLCGFGGLPNGDPVPIDEVVDQPLSDFVFASDLKSFSMAKTVVAQDSNSTTTWQYEGTETGRQLVSAPACLCP